MEKMRVSAPQDYAMQQGEQKLHTGKWSWHSIVQKGVITPQAGLLAPVTTSLLMRAPLMTGVPFAYAFYSSLAPSAEITPHYGPTNLRLRVHLPLSVPPEPDSGAIAGGAAAGAQPPLCGIRVAGETRTWDGSAAGTPLVFDDAYEHETWNRHPSAARDILLFDVWHPELSRDEIAALQGMFDDARRAGWLK